MHFILLFFFLIFSTEACMSTHNTPTIAPCTKCPHTLPLGVEECPLFNECNICTRAVVTYAGRTTAGCATATVTCPDAVGTAYVSMKLGTGAAQSEALSSLGVIRCDNTGKWLYTQSDGTLTPINKIACYHMSTSGVQQSPIDIQTADSIYNSSLTMIDINYAPNDGDRMEWSHAKHGFTIYTYAPNDRSTFTASQTDGNTYQLYQMHGHWGNPTKQEGSEHLINGMRYAGEFHFVHFNNALYPDLPSAVGQPNGLAVIGVLVTIGEENPEFTKLTSLMEVDHTLGNEANIGFDYNKMLPAGRNFYTYTGSLTTPEYSTCVLWTVLTEPITLSQEQFDILYKVGTDHVREVQKITGPIFNNFATGARAISNQLPDALQKLWYRIKEKKREEEEKEEEEEKKEEEEEEDDEDEVEKEIEEIVDGVQSSFLTEL